MSVTLVAVPPAVGAGAAKVVAPHAAVVFSLPSPITPYEAAAGGASGALRGFGNLYGSGDLGATVAPGTSPSVIGVDGVGFAVAVHGANGDLWVTDPNGTTDTKLGLAPGTSPSIAALSTGGYEVAFTA
ncbi:hypothetical protein, partial [Actinacidiphila epipremni]